MARKLSVIKAKNALGITKRELFERAYAHTYKTVADDRVGYDLDRFNEHLDQHGYEWVPDTYMNVYLKHINAMVVLKGAKNGESN